MLCDEDALRIEGAGFRQEGVIGQEAPPPMVLEMLFPEMNCLFYVSDVGSVLGPRKALASLGRARLGQQRTAGFS